MGETYQQRHQHQTSTSSRLGLRSGVGEIVEVQGGHIVRSTGRKDRHSKVCTAKGPRDRRVRLSAHTAIQFYDVQDRLGYDRPSKALDWLIRKAKAAIDELAELPAWKPTTGSAANVEFGQDETQKKCEDNHQDSAHNQHQQLSMVDGLAGPSCKRALTMLGNEGEGQGLHHSSTNGNLNGSSSISFLPPSLDSDSIADTIKSFFPMGASAEANTSAMQFQSFPPPDLLSRTSSQNQDLRLSLQSFQDPIMLHHQHHRQAQHQNPTSHSEQELVHAQAQAAFFSGTTPVQLGFDGSGWSDQHHQQQHIELGRFQRLAAWNAGGDTGSTSGGGAAAAVGGGGYLFNSAPGPSLLQPFFGHNQFFSQRGPLQSSNTPPVRAWMDPSAIAIATTEHSQHHQHHQAMLLNYPPSLSGIGLASGVSGFSGFRIPARIQGDEEEHDGISDKPSSASSDSRH